MKLVARLFSVVLFFVAVSEAHAQTWLEAYQRGTAAAQKQEWRVVVEEMSRAIADKPQEEIMARGRRTSVLYVPHFWLGQALIQTGHPARGERQLRISEAQGVIQKTALYAELKAALSAAAAERDRERDKASEATKAAADKALGLAMAAQVKATGAGATRTEQFRRASQKLKDGFSSRKISDYEGALKSARLASHLFDESIAAARVSTARVGAQPSTASEATVPPPPTQQAVVERIEPEPIIPDAGQVAAMEVALAAPGKPAADRVLVEPSAKGRSEEQRLTTRQPAVQTVKTSDLLKQAYMAFARGDLSTADTISGVLIATSDQRLEGYMLRACARYTASLLTKRSELEQAAAGDFRAALAISRSATLDPQYFSPKVIEFFRKQR